MKNYFVVSGLLTESRISHCRINNYNDPENTGFWDATIIQLCRDNQVLSREHLDKINAYVANITDESDRIAVIRSLQDSKRLREAIAKYAN